MIPNGRREKIAKLLITELGVTLGQDNLKELIWLRYYQRNSEIANWAEFEIHYQKVFELLDRAICTVWEDLKV